MVGVSRLIRAFSITSPLGDPSLEPNKEKEMRYRYMEEAIAMLQKDGEVGHSAAQ